MAAMVGRGLPTDDQNLMAYAQGLPNAPPQQDPDGAYGTLGPATPSWSQWVGDKAQDAMSALGASKT